MPNAARCGAWSGDASATLPLRGLEVLRYTFAAFQCSTRTWREHMTAVLATPIRCSSAPTVRVWRHMTVRDPRQNGRIFEVCSGHNLPPRPFGRLLPTVGRGRTQDIREIS